MQRRTLIGRIQNIVRAMAARTHGSLVQSGLFQSAPMHALLIRREILFMAIPTNLHLMIEKDRRRRVFHGAHPVCDAMAFAAIEQRTCTDIVLVTCLGMHTAPQCNELLNVASAASLSEMAATERRAWIGDGQRLVFRVTRHAAGRRQRDRIVRLRHRLRTL